VRAFHIVIPAEAGIQTFVRKTTPQIWRQVCLPALRQTPRAAVCTHQEHPQRWGWIPASAGMTTSARAEAGAHRDTTAKNLHIGLSRRSKENVVVAGGFTSL
jgi:hypothetical protein